MAKPAARQQDSNGSAHSAQADTTTESLAAGKGRPTPTRKEREAANTRPLVSKDRRGDKASRAKYNEARDRARIGMANGEEKFLPTRDKGLQRRYIRDYIDARFSIGELMIPVMLIIIVLTFVEDLRVQALSVIGLWVFFIIAVIDCVIAGILVNRRLSAKFGSDKLQKGNRWYTAMRCLQLRAMRLPKPQAKRGQYPAL